MVVKKKSRFSLYLFIAAAVILIAYLFYSSSFDILASPQNPPGGLKPRSPTPNPAPVVEVTPLNPPCTCVGGNPAPAPLDRPAPGACRMVSTGRTTDGVKRCVLTCANQHACTPVDVPIALDGVVPQPPPTIRNTGDTFVISQCAIICPPGWQVIQP